MIWGEVVFILHVEIVFVEYERYEVKMMDFPKAF